MTDRVRTENSDHIHPARDTRVHRAGALVRLLAALVGSVETYRVLLAVVSAGTTWWGITLIYNAIGAGAEGSLGLLKFVLPVAVAGFLHCVIFLSLQRWTSVRRWCYLAFAIPLQALAALASYTTHWVHLNGDAETTGTFTQAQGTTIRGILAFAQSYRTVGDAMERLAQHSTEQARIEATQGTSCQPGAGTGRGPRYDLRMADAATFAEFRTQVAGRLTRIEDLAKRAEALSAGSGADAMAKLPALRRVVDEIKAVEADLLLPQLRAAAEQRLAKGRAPIAIPPAQRGADRATSFTCPDPRLDGHLTTVIEAIRALKPVPEIAVIDARDPREGAMLALQRLIGTLASGELPTLSMEALKKSRTRALAGGDPADGGLKPTDLTALGLAILVELMLLIAFLIGNRTHVDHPGLDPLARSLARERSRIFRRAWRKVGGRADGLAAILDRHMKHEHRATLLVVPLYTDDAEEQALHRMMELLVGVGLARRIYTGRALARAFTLGWPKSIRSSALRSGHVRVYRLDEQDHHALILDSLGEDDAAPAPEGARTRNDEHTVIHLPPPDPPRRAA